jgi:hypothetical protein
VKSTQGIPQHSPIRQSPDERRTSLDKLMQPPKHHVTTMKFDPLTMKRTSYTLTLEDTDQFINLGLLSTLRAPKLSSRKQDGNSEDAPVSSIPVPPSFYDEDL